MSNGLCSNHGQVDAVWKEGTSKSTGRPFGFFACPKSEKDQFGNWVKCKVTMPKDEGAQFVQQLDKSGYKMDAQTKDELIIRTAIAKSLIERGSVWNMDTVAEAEKVLSWVTGKNKALVDALLKGQSVGVAESISRSEGLEPPAPEDDVYRGRKVDEDMSYPF